jgi:hypothetical protein
VGHGDQLPVAVTVGDFVHKDRGGLSISLSSCGGQVSANGGQRCNSNQQDSDPSRNLSSQKAKRPLGVQNFFALGHYALLVKSVLVNGEADAIAAACRLLPSSSRNTERDGITAVEHTLARRKRRDVPLAGTEISTGIEADYNFVV